jgi:Secretion system C-terminal sorting domain
MKLFSTIFLSLIVLTTSMNAQFTDFTAKSGYDTAIGMSDLSDPKLLSVGAVVDEIDLGTPFGLTQFNINLATGQATVWAYSFAESSDPSVLEHVVLAFTPLGPFNIINSQPDLADRLDAIVPLTHLNTDEKEWIGSVAFFNNITASSEYQNLSQSFTDSKIMNVGLGNNEYNTAFPIDEPYWTANFGENEDFTCVSHALTGETECYEPTIDGIIDFGNYPEFNIYPQPAVESLTLKIPTELQSASAKLFIYDMSGKMIQQLNSPIGGEEFFVPLVGIESGVYFIKYQTNENIYSVKFTKK